MARIPTFLYIGAAKAGSSWIYTTLRQHPQVFIPLKKRTFFLTDILTAALPGMRLTSMLRKTRLPLERYATTTSYRRLQPNGYKKRFPT
jgi:hypothetical protein